MTRIGTLALVLLTLLLGACAHAERTRERDAQALEEFEQFAGAPIRRIHHFTAVDRWRSFNDHQIVIWIGVNRAYLLTLQKPCFDLHRQLAIRVTGSNGFIDANFDRVEFEQQRCRIMEIREIDEKARKAARRAAKAEG